MLEHMARALWDDREAHQLQRCRMTWEEGSDVARKFATDHARAILVAMRQPSTAMLAAIDDEDSDKYVARGRAISAWMAMIDAALRPT